MAQGIMVPTMPTVRLRSWRAADAREIEPMTRDEHIRRWSSMGGDLERWIARQRRGERGPSRVICLPDDDRVLGKVAVRMPGHASSATTCEAVVAADGPVGELSYWLLPAARGRGLARAAVESMVGWAAAATGLRSVVLDIEVGNSASVGLAIRLGAQRREPERVELDCRGDRRRMVVFVLAIER
jgi:RimJ/RimL family protein N-acetyltransferase